MPYTATAIFAVSLLVLFFMIYFRTLEIKRRKAFLTTRILNNVDWTLSKKAAWFKIHVYAWAMRVVFFSISRFKLYAMRVLRNLRLKLDSLVLRTVIWLRGKRILLRNKGSVSFFLRHISEHNKEWTQD